MGGWLVVGAPSGRAPLLHTFEVCQPCGTAGIHKPGIMSPRPLLLWQQKAIDDTRVQCGVLSVTDLQSATC
jgi:hypothetical protein